ncbi:FG-GAP and VCBS repeat-containing protein [Streptomyces sp. JNUCC 64]
MTRTRESALSWHLRSRPVLAAALTAALAGGLLTAAGSPAAAAPAKHVDDFDGDGFRDYAQSGSGEFTVTYGTATGPGSRTKTFTQNSRGIPGRSLSDREYFGEELATADFNRDGYADVAVSDSYEKVGGRAVRGMVVIVWGSRSGLGAKATSLSVRHSESRKQFGRALAAGDFNGDGKPDLAVADHSSVYVYRGGFSSRTGRTGAVTRHEHRRLMETHGLVAGKVTKDRATDLYVLGQGYDQARSLLTSDVWFLRGGTTVRSGKYRTVKRDFPYLGVRGVIADFDRDGYGDLALREQKYRSFRGAVLVVRGGSGGPGASHRLTQSTRGVATSARAEDDFGARIATGKIDGDRYPDLAVSAQGETVAGTRAAGGVHVLRGGPRGLTGTGSQWFSRATRGIPGEPVEYGQFGQYLAVRDLDRDGHADVLASEWRTLSVVVPGGPGGVRTADAREIQLKAELP